MRRAADRMIEEVLVRAPATRLIASANHDNHRSQALILGPGFMEDGEAQGYVDVPATTGQTPLFPPSVTGPRRKAPGQE